MSEFFQQALRVRLLSALAIPVRNAAPAISANRILVLTAAAGALAGLAGCGSNLRPTVTPITGTGPASQPASYAFVVSAPISSPTAQGYGTVIDYSGDTVMATAPIGPGPGTFALNGGGTLAWTINEDGTVSNVPISTNLQEKQITYSTLNQIPPAGTPNDPAGLNPVVGLFGSTLGLYALDDNLNEVDVLTGSPDAFKLDVPVDLAPVTAVGVSGATRIFAITQGIPYLTPYAIPGGPTVDGGVACTVAPHSVTATGLADGIETGTNYTVSSHIPLGVCPDYAVGSPDTRRVYVLNRGSDTITVINSQNNTLDTCTPGVNQNGQPYTCHPTLPLSTTAVTNTGIQPPNGTAGLPAVAGPVYAEFNAATEQLIVSNYDGSTINIIDVSLDEYGNDSATFGTTYTVAVGKNPASVTVLADGSRAYTANQTDGTVTVVDLASHTVETTLPVTGNPRTVASTQNSLYGKVYVASPNSATVTIIRTDQDIIDTTVLVQGNSVDVRTTSPDTTNPNTNLTSRLPGAGQPCYLPLSAFAAGAPVTIANCQVRDTSLLTSAPLSTAAPLTVAVRK
jgi:YVTN family beta-propeller protein